MTNVGTTNDQRYFHRHWSLRILHWSLLLVICVMHTGWFPIDRELLSSDLWLTERFTRGQALAEQLKLRGGDAA